MSKENKRKYYIFELDLKVMNIFSLILFFLALPLCLLLKDFNLYNVDMILFFILYIVWIIIHELLHGISYIINGANKKKITYGAYLEKGICYCLCKQNITRKNILNSILAPCFYLSIVTGIIALIISSPILLLLAIANLSGCAGDILMFIYISRLNKNIEYSEFDNPTRFAIYADYDVSKTKHLGLKYIEEIDLLKKEDLTRLSISKGSIIVLSIMVIVGLLCLIF